jgi:hypothetical protein
MRALPLLAALALLAPVALADATLVDESRILSCLLRVQVSGVGTQLNCPGVQRIVAAAEPAGGTYRFTATWAPADALWTQLEAQLVSCQGGCDIQGGVAACVNGVCAGNPGAGPTIVEQASIVGASPIVLDIPTAGAETNVTFVLNAPGPVFASLSGQSVHYTLRRIG